MACRSFKGFQRFCFSSFFKPISISRSLRPSRCCRGPILASFISSNTWWAFRNSCSVSPSLRPIRCYQKPSLAPFISSSTWWAFRNSSSISLSPRPIQWHQERVLASSISSNTLWAFRNLSSSSSSSHNGSSSSVRVVISEGKPRFETYEIDPPKKHKWLTKKRLKLQRKKEKKKRKSANKRDPRRLTIKGSKRKGKFADAEERIKYKLEKARIKEASLIDRLKRYEVPKLQGPTAKPVGMTGEERFYMKKMAQKGSNYVPVGRRGVFGGVILNMHMHWKKHETVKVVCRPCKPGQVHEYAAEIARLSGGVPIHVVGDNTIVFYRGKEYVLPEVMSPIDTLSKKRALEKSKYEQSLESVRHFIAIAEQELELYRRHIALYGNTDEPPAGGGGDTTTGVGFDFDFDQGVSETMDGFTDENSSGNDDVDGDDDADQTESDGSCSESGSNGEETQDV